MYSRHLACVLWLAGASALASAPVAAQSRPPQPGERLTFSASLGGFTDMGGFSQDDDFYAFDKTLVWGAGLHYGLNGGMSIGLDGLIGKPDYKRFQRTQGTELGNGTADFLSVLASARLSGSPGPLGVFLAGGAGMFRWNLDEIGANTDLALTVGIGAELEVAGRLSVFAEYGSWWVYHEKDDSVVKNTARHTLLRAGGRIGIL